MATTTYQKQTFLATISSLWNMVSSNKQSSPEKVARKNVPRISGTPYLSLAYGHFLYQRVRHALFLVGVQGSQYDCQSCHRSNGEQPHRESGTFLLSLLRQDDGAVHTPVCPSLDDRVSKSRDTLVSLFSALLSSSSAGHLGVYSTLVDYTVKI